MDALGAGILDKSPRDRATAERLRELQEQKDRINDKWAKKNQELLDSKELQVKDFLFKFCSIKNYTFYFCVFRHML